MGPEVPPVVGPGLGAGRLGTLGKLKMLKLYKKMGQPILFPIYIHYPIYICFVILLFFLINHQFNDDIIWVFLRYAQE